MAASGEFMLRGMGVSYGPELLQLELVLVDICLVLPFFGNCGISVASSNSHLILESASTYSQVQG